MRVLESDPVGTGPDAQKHPEQVTGPLQDTHVPTHTPSRRQFKVCNQPDVHVNSNNEDSHQYLREGKKKKRLQKRHIILKYNQTILKVFV